MQTHLEATLQWESSIAQIIRVTLSIAYNWLSKQAFSMEKMSILSPRNSIISTLLTNAYESRGYCRESFVHRRMVKHKTLPKKK